MKHAVKKTGLKDFGDLGFADCYSKLHNSSVHRVEKYSNIGFISARMELNMTMSRRLRLIEEYLKKNPQVLETPVRSPVFVLGLPRTGTTFLHRLLSLDPATRAPTLWELLESVPKIDCTDPIADRKRRANKVRALLNTRKAMGDKALDHIHEIDADLAEECIIAMSDEIPMVMQYLHTAYVLADEWFDIVQSSQVVKTYKWYKQVLQLLSYQMGSPERENPKRWMLKCPIHMFYPKEIAVAFPDAKLIWNHRHPVSAVPSLCSLLKAFHSVYYETDTNDDAVLGRKVASVSAKLLIDTPKNIAESELQSADVLYHDLVNDPLQTVKDVYRQFGWEVSAEYEAIIQAYLEADRKKRERISRERAAKKVTANKAATPPASPTKKGGGWTEADEEEEIPGTPSGKKEKKKVLHQYSPEEFSLTVEDLSTGVYAEYVRKYNLPVSMH
eukprot:CAMPEP_0170071386 /NCGR_PEP_ID=MMETSP0019_2-20121128/9342_1 /TAXON_ID=98059 /ORGANISM="Dinobryon sp., Strain UTEXLB2267" /LENGTH=443 /DNA_ID=CAMNT_0010279941 /DNA_START=160 /DNA_END=1491 /DNA_ORIENTATION=-